MREALRLTEGNLGSLIASRDALGLGDFTVIGKLMLGWRDVVRKALSDWPTPEDSDDTSPPPSAKGEKHE